MFTEQPLPIIKETAVVLDDSDEDEGAKTDSSVESELEFELHENENVVDFIKASMEKLAIPNQIDGAIKSVSERVDVLNNDAMEINDGFLALER